MDSGGSLQMMSKKPLTRKEKTTVRTTDDPDGPRSIGDVEQPLLNNEKYPSNVDRITTFQSSL